MTPTRSRFFCFKTKSLNEVEAIKDVSSGAKYFVDIHGVTILIGWRHCVVFFHQSLLSFACSGKNDVFSPKNLRVRQLLPIAGR